MARSFNEKWYLQSKLEQCVETGQTDANGQPYTMATLKAAIENAGFSVEEHYQKYSSTEGTHAYTQFNFDEDYYLESKLAQLASIGETGWTKDSLIKAINKIGLTVEQHYLKYSTIEGTSANPYFNTTECLEAKLHQLQNSADASERAEWANKTAADVAKAIADAGMSAEEHYQRYGCKEVDQDGKLINPSNAFDANAYVAAKLAELQKTDPANWADKDAQDVADAITKAGLTPVSHYEKYGKAEGEEAGIDMLQTVPVVDRVANDPLRDTMGDNVPSNYNPSTPAPKDVEASEADSVAKPCDMAELSDEDKPADPVAVPGDEGYVAPPANVVDTNENPVVLVQETVKDAEGNDVTVAQYGIQANETTDADGNKVESVNAIKEDGTADTENPIQTVTTASDGTVTTETSVEDAEGNKIESKTETKPNGDSSAETTAGFADGSKVEESSSTVTNEDGTKTETSSTSATVPNEDGTTTTTSVEETKNSDGSSTKVEATVTEDENGTVVASKEVTTDTASDGSKVVETVETKDGQTTTTTETYDSTGTKTGETTDSGSGSGGGSGGGSSSSTDEIGPTLKSAEVTNAKTVVLTFDKDVIVADDSQILANGNVVSSATADGSVVTLTLANPTTGDVTVTAPLGAFTNSDGAKAAAINRNIEYTTTELSATVVDTTLTIAGDSTEDIAIDLSAGTAKEGTNELTDSETGEALNLTGVTTINVEGLAANSCSVTLTTGSNIVIEANQPADVVVSGFGDGMTLAGTFSTEEGAEVSDGSMSLSTATLTLSATEDAESATFAGTVDVTGATSLNVEGASAVDISEATLGAGLVTLDLTSDTTEVAQELTLTDAQYNQFTTVNMTPDDTLNVTDDEEEGISINVSRNLVGTINAANEGTIAAADGTDLSEATLENFTTLDLDAAAGVNVTVNKTQLGAFENVIGTDDGEDTVTISDDIASGDTVNFATGLGYILGGSGGNTVSVGDAGVTITTNATGIDAITLGGGEDEVTLSNTADSVVLSVNDEVDGVVATDTINDFAYGNVVDVKTGLNSTKIVSVDPAEHALVSLTSGYTYTVASTSEIEDLFGVAADSVFDSASLGSGDTVYVALTGSTNTKIYSVSGVANDSGEVTVTPTLVATLANYTTAMTTAGLGFAAGDEAEVKTADLPNLIEADEDNVPVALTDNTTIVLTFDKDVTVGDEDAFVVTVNGSPVELAATGGVLADGASVTLTLASALAFDDSVVVSLNPGAVLDEAGHGNAAEVAEPVIYQTDQEGVTGSADSADSATLVLEGKATVDVTVVLTSEKATVTDGDNTPQEVEGAFAAINTTAVVADTESVTISGLTATSNYTITTGNSAKITIDAAGYTSGELTITNNSSDPANVEITNPSTATFSGTFTVGEAKITEGSFSATNATTYTLGGEGASVSGTVGANGVTTIAIAANSDISFVGDAEADPEVTAAEFGSDVTMLNLDETESTTQKVTLTDTQLAFETINMGAGDTITVDDPDADGTEITLSAGTFSGGTIAASNAPIEGHDAIEDDPATDADETAAAVAAQPNVITVSNDGTAALDLSFVTLTNFNKLAMAESGAVTINETQFGNFSGGVAVAENQTINVKSTTNQGPTITLAGALEGSGGTVAAKDSGGATANNGTITIGADEINLSETEFSGFTTIDLGSSEDNKYTTTVNVEQLVGFTGGISGDVSDTVKVTGTLNSTVSPLTLYVPKTEALIDLTNAEYPDASATAVTITLDTATTAEQYAVLASAYSGGTIAFTGGDEGDTVTLYSAATSGDATQEAVEVAFAQASEVPEYVLDAAAQGSTVRLTNTTSEDYAAKSFGDNFTNLVLGARDATPATGNAATISLAQFYKFESITGTLNTAQEGLAQYVDVLSLSGDASASGNYSSAASTVDLTHLIGEVGEQEAAVRTDVKIDLSAVTNMTTLNFGVTVTNTPADTETATEASSDPAADTAEQHVIVSATQMDALTTIANATSADTIEVSGGLGTSTKATLTDTAATIILDDQANQKVQAAEAGSSVSTSGMSTNGATLISDSGADTFDVSGTASDVVYLSLNGVDASEESLVDAITGFTGGDSNNDVINVNVLLGNTVNTIGGTGSTLSSGSAMTVLGSNGTGSTLNLANSIFTLSSIGDLSTLGIKASGSENTDIILADNDKCVVFAGSAQNYDIYLVEGVAVTEPTDPVYSTTKLATIELTGSSVLYADNIDATALA